MAGLGVFNLRTYSRNSEKSFQGAQQNVARHDVPDSQLEQQVLPTLKLED